MPDIQIPFNFSCSLSDYYKKIKGGKIQIPTFDDYCPICGGKNCPVFLGFYFRKVVDENGTYYEAFPIIRLKCNRKGFKTTRHRTFSLLPDQLIPYNKYSIPFVFKAMKEWKLKGKSVKEVLDELALLGEGSVISISPSTLYKFERLVFIAIERIIATGFWQKIHSLINVQDKEKRMRRFLRLFDRWTRAPTLIAHQFYLFGGGCKKNGPYLFGIPSQFRF